MSFELHNPGDDALPASFGAHPAFRWPLLPGLPRAEHWLEFEKPETGPLPMLDPDGLLGDPVRDCPLRGRVLHLEDALFEQDALVFRPVMSRAVRYAAPGAPGLEVGWEGFRAAGGVDPARRRLPLHRALARLRQPGGVRRRVRREAGDLPRQPRRHRLRPVLRETAPARNRTGSEILMNRIKAGKQEGRGAPIEDPQVMQDALQVLFETETEFFIKVEGAATLPYASRVQQLQTGEGRFTLKLVRPLPHEMLSGAPFRMVFAVEDLRFEALISFLGREGYLQVTASISPPACSRPTGASTSATLSGRGRTPTPSPRTPGSRGSAWPARW